MLLVRDYSREELINFMECLDLNRQKLSRLFNLDRQYVNEKIKPTDIDKDINKCLFRQGLSIQEISSKLNISNHIVSLAEVYYKSKFKEINYQVLEELYNDDNISVEYIADKFDISLSKANKILNFYGFDISNRSIDYITENKLSVHKNEILRMFDDGYDKDAIYNKFNIDSKTAKKLIKQDPNKYKDYYGKLFTPKYEDKTLKVNALMYNNPDKMNIADSMFYKGYSLKEISDATGISKYRVEKYLSYKYDYDAISRFNLPLYIYYVNKGLSAVEIRNKMKISCRNLSLSVRINKAKINKIKKAIVLCEKYPKCTEDFLRNKLEWTWNDRIKSYVNSYQKIEKSKNK